MYFIWNSWRRSRKLCCVQTSLLLQELLVRIINFTQPRSRISINSIYLHNLRRCTWSWNFSSSVIIKIVNIYGIHSPLPGFFPLKFMSCLCKSAHCAHCTVLWVRTIRLSRNLQFFPSIHFTFRYFPERDFVAWQLRVIIKSLPQFFPS